MRQRTTFATIALLCFSLLCANDTQLSNNINAITQKNILSEKEAKEPEAIAECQSCQMASKPIVPPSANSDIPEEPGLNSTMPIEGIISKEGCPIHSPNVCSKPVCGENADDNRWKGRISSGINVLSGTDNFSSWDLDFKLDKNICFNELKFYRWMLKGKEKIRVTETTKRVLVDGVLVERNFNVVKVNEGEVKFLMEQFLNQRTVFRIEDEVEWDRGRRLDVMNELTFGLGYYLLKQDCNYLEVYAGLSHFDSFYRRGRGNQNYFAMEVGVEVNWKLTSRLTVEYTFEVYPELSNFKNIWFESDLTLIYKFSDSWAFTVVYDYIYDAEPPPKTAKYDSDFSIKLTYTF